MDPTTRPDNAARTLFCFGKLPTCGDFVRHNASGAAARALEAWLQQGLYLAKPMMARQGAGSARPARHGFVFTDPEGQEAAVGAFRMSRDQVGRIYPFVAASLLGERGSAFSSAAQVVNDSAAFLNWASAFVDRAAVGDVDRHALVDMLAEAPHVGGATKLGTADLTVGVSFGSLCTQMWDRFDDGRKYIVFRNLLDVVEPLRGGIPSRYALGIRCPLGKGGESNVPLAFWLQVISRLVGPGCSALFWTSGADGLNRPFVLLYPGVASSKGAPVLFADEYDSDVVCDLERMGRLSPDETRTTLPPSWARLLEDERIGLQEFVASL